MSKSPVVISSKGQLDGILKSSTIVVADFFADWCGPCRQIAPLYETLSHSLTRPNLVTFVKINNDSNQDLAEEYGVSALPTFLIFRDAKVMEKVQGANPKQLQGVVTKLAAQVETLGESSASGTGPWRGAEIPRGYIDITDQIEKTGCELLNADEAAGPVRVLFETSKPSALEKGDSSANDWVESGADDQLLLFIPFQSSIKLHTLQLTSLPPQGQDDVSRPEVIRLYINRTQNMDFGEADETEPTQAITLTADDWNPDGTANIGLRFVKFQKTTTLVVYVQQGYGSPEKVRIDRLKLVGEAGPRRDMGKLQKVGDDE
ncbi:PITH domain-containing protein [Hirsutella rhossiliensis]|uniref:PITH domain-containing protein n=1 Tax=Hirsutella rhossiliensis TaxID=111463 RepID=A0A9P8N2X1_9HYPO|nr:PITH domain-containing protein [Hirsutella rhossiliensis]KAH0967313.1 PITH domain-containing protein [Hirsutella rhossiliensis]